MTTETYNLIRSHLFYSVEKCGQWEDGEDVIQDVAYYLLTKDAWFEALPENEKGYYIRTCIRNRAIDIKRIRYSAKRNPFFWGRPVTITRPEVYAIIDLKDVIKKAQRRKLICNPLFYSVLGFNDLEIEKIEEVDANTIRQRRRYARKFLRDEKKEKKHTSNKAA